MPLPIAAPGNTEPLRHAQEWLDHVHAERIAANPGITSAQLARHLRNELVVLGEIR